MEVIHYTPSATTAADAHAGRTARRSSERRRRRRLAAGLLGPAGPRTVSDAEWDRLAGPDFYSTAAWLRFCGAHGGAEQTAVIAQLDRTQRAALPAARLTELPSAFYRWSDILAELGLPALAPLGTLLGPRQGYHTNLLRSPCTDPVAAAAAVLDALWAEDHAEPAVAMYMVSSDAAAFVRAGAPALPLLVEPDAEIPVPGGGFDAWLGTLSSKRRVTVRRERRAFLEAGYTVEDRPLSECCELLAPLAEATLAKYGHTSTAQDHLATLRGHVDHMGSAARVLTFAREGDVPAGFCLYYQHRDTTYLRWAGFDYKRLAGAEEYFNLVYYEQIARLSAQGGGLLHAGIKATEAKALRGARLRPLWLLDLSRDSLLKGRDPEIRARNRARLDELTADPRTAPAVRDNDEWGLFT